MSARGYSSRGLARIPGFILNAEPSTTETSNVVESRWFYPRITEGQDYTIPVGAELSFDSTTWLTAGDRVWPASKKCKVRGPASAEYETPIEYDFVFNGVIVVYSITTEPVPSGEVLFGGDSVTFGGDAAVTF